MNRISKRRLLLRLKRELSVACVGLLFDPNDATMGESLKSAIKSVLEPIQVNRGIIDFKIELDESAEAKDRLELPQKYGLNLLKCWNIFLSNWLLHQTELVLNNFTNIHK